MAATARVLAHVPISDPCRKVNPPKHEVMLHKAAPQRYVVSVAANPSDAAPVRITLPRTIRAIKQALTAEQRAQFMAELEDIEAGGLRAVVEKWWVTAVMNRAGTWDRIAEVRAGTARTLPIEAVIPDFAERYEQHHGRPYTPHSSR